MQAGLDPLDLSPAEILARCKNLVPVNTVVEKAIAAHRIAFEHYIKKDRSAADWQEAHTLAMYTLRAVILARTPDASDCRQQIDYLSALPETAWEPWMEHTSREIREETLAGITRCLMWRLIN
jgi:hypothetical protein